MTPTTLSIVSLPCEALFGKSRALLRESIAAPPQVNTAIHSDNGAAQRARNATMQITEWGLTATHLIIDYDTKFAESFDAVLEAEGTEINRVGPQAPNMNAYAERFVQTLPAECLDHFLICGERHLHQIVHEFVAHYLEERPHQGLGNVPLAEVGGGLLQDLPFPSGEVHCRERLGGLLKHYYHTA